MGMLTERSRPRLKFSLGDSHNMVVRLILINLVVFVGLLFTRVIYMLTQHAGSDFVSEVIPWAVLPADPARLLTHPWTVLTYMFVHVGFWHLLSTLIWLWWFGELLQGLSGYRHVAPVYLYGGLAGALFFVLAYTFIPDLHPAQLAANSVNIGAAASIMAIIIAVTVLSPNYRVFPMLGGGIPIYVIAIVYVALSLLGQQGGDPLGYIAAQTGGAIMGAVYALRLKSGYDPGGGLNRIIYLAGHVFDPADDKPHPLHARTRRQKKADGQDVPYRRVGPVAESRVDDILDKINRSGYQSLSQEEKETLLRASKEGEV